MMDTNEKDFGRMWWYSSVVAGADIVVVASLLIVRSDRRIMCVPLLFDISEMRRPLLTFCKPSFTGLVLGSLD